MFDGERARMARQRPGLRQPSAALGRACVIAKRRRAAAVQDLAEIRTVHEKGER